MRMQIPIKLKIIREASMEITSGNLIKKLMIQQTLFLKQLLKENYASQLYLKFKALQILNLWEFFQKTDTNGSLLKSPAALILLLLFQFHFKITFKQKSLL